MCEYESRLRGEVGERRSVAKAARRVRGNFPATERVECPPHPATSLASCSPTSPRKRGEVELAFAEHAG